MLRNILALLVAISILGTLCVSTFGQGVCCTVFSDLANEKRGDRLLWGTVAAIGGTALAGLALALLPVDYGIAYFSAGSALCFVAGPGVWNLVVPSKTEREFARLESTGRGCEETSCSYTLNKLADRAKSNRYLSALVSGAGALAGAVLGDVTTALSSAAYAVWHVLFPSEEERAYERYQAFSGQTY